MYSGKTVLITGSSRGIGKELVAHFLRNHAYVIGIYKQPQGDIPEKYNPHLHLILDLSDSVAIIKGISQIPYGIDILINNAAILTSQYSTKMDISDARGMVLVDFLAVFLVTRECVKLMKKIPYGRIINISSMAVSLEPIGDSIYAACKSGITTMANIMAKEYSFMNITCNTLAISAIETDMLKQLNKEKIDKVVAGLPIPRYATIEDITNVIDFFCSPKSNYITSQTIYLGGVH
jgi:3-oxoacyl-[acyl-carrier protein] reductase